MVVLFLSNHRRPSRPSSHRQEQEYEYETRRREQQPRSGESRSRSRDYDDYDRPRSGERGAGSRPPASRPAGSRPANGSRPAPRPPVRRPVKRRKKRLPILQILFGIALLVIIVLLFHACGSKEELPPGEYSLEFTPSQSLFVGDVGEVRIVGLPEDFSGTITWSSSNSSVLQIENGIMKAKNPGDSLIAAIIDGQTYSGTSGTVIVYAVPENVGPIVMSPSSAATLLSGRTLQLEAIVTLEDGSDPMNLPINWSSSSIAVASVTQDGLVTARDVGSAAITAKLGNQSAVCVITVQRSGEGELVQSTEGYGDPNAPTPEGQPEAPAGTEQTPSPEAVQPQTPPPTTQPTTPAQPPAATVSSLILSQNIGNLDVGGKLQLGATASPSNSSVSWNSSNPSVATVSPDGVVTAVGVGEAVITATAGSLSSHCSIRVDVPGDPNAQPSDGGTPAAGHN